MKYLRIKVEGKTYEVEVELLDEQIEKSSSIHSESSVSMSDSNLPAPESKPPKTNAGNENVIASPLSAVVVSIDVSVGENVDAGQKVITLEAMKMNTVVTASVAGKIEEVLVSEGNSVEEGQALMKFS